MVFTPLVPVVFLAEFWQYFGDNVLKFAFIANFHTLTNKSPLGVNTAIVINIYVYESTETCKPSVPISQPNFLASSIP